MSSVLPIDPTPITIIKMDKGSGLSGFLDDDPADVAAQHLRRMRMRGMIGESFDAEITQMIADVVRENPREITRRMGIRASVVDQMKALRDMPADLAKRFESGETAIINTRALFRQMKGAENLESVKNALSPSYRSDGRKIQHTRLTIPLEASTLPQLIAQAYEQTGQRAIVEPGAEFNYVHAFTCSVYHTPAFNEMKDAIAEEQPFTLGGRPGILTPYAWAILCGMGAWALGDAKIEPGNAVRSQRPGTKGLRKLYREWKTAVHLYSKSIQPPHGLSDEAAISIPPTPEVIAEVERYMKAFASRFWDGRRGVKQTMDAVLATKKHRRVKKKPAA